MTYGEPNISDSAPGDANEQIQIDLEDPKHRRVAFAGLAGLFVLMGIDAVCHEAIVYRLGGLVFAGLGAIAAKAAFDAHNEIPIEE